MRSYLGVEVVRDIKVVAVNRHCGLTSESETEGPVRSFRFLFSVYKCS